MSLDRRLVGPEADLDAKEKSISLGLAGNPDRSLLAKGP
jgi:hypothetical protein